MYQDYKCTAAWECPIPMRRAWNKVQSRVPLPFPFHPRSPPQLSLPCEENFGHNRCKGGQKHYLQQILYKSQAMSQKQLFYTSSLPPANTIEMNEWRSKYLNEAHKSLFFSFPGLSHSALLIDSKVKTLSLWSSIREAWWLLYFPQGILINLLSLLLFPIYCILTSERNNGVSHVHLPWKKWRSRSPLK